VLFSENVLLQACRTLFGHELRITVEFLQYLQLSGVKRAFRQRALETHPDQMGICCDHKINGSVAFTEVRAAHDTLVNYLCQRECLSRPVVVKAERAEAKTQYPWQRQQNRSYGSFAAASASFPEGGTYNNNLRGHIFPPRRLKLGRYLCYAQVVEWRDVIDALVWQRASRPRLGELACLRGYLHEDDIRYLLSNNQAGCRFGQRAIALGVLNQYQLEQLLNSQKSLQQKIGRYFVLHKLIARYELPAHIKNYYLHNSKFPVAR
jgi:hypothetical protein